MYEMMKTKTTRRFGNKKVRYFMNENVDSKIELVLVVFSIPFERCSGK